MSFRQYYALTVEEFKCLVTGYEARLKEQRGEAARWVANLMNATGNFEKKPVTVEALLGTEVTLAERNRKRLRKRVKEQDAARD